MQIKKDLKNWLKDFERLVIIGLGNELRGDDALGVYVIKKLIGDREYKEYNNILIINAKTVPDFFLNIIREFKPSHILFIDCVISNKAPGTIYLIDKDDIQEFIFSTHTLPLEVIVKYIGEKIEVKILGVEPKSLDFFKMSEEVKRSGDKIVKIIKEILYI
ncbi:hydrogenase maturation protease HycI [Methanocaldococcus infernus ME]|uniref:Hydrogenase maturation protease HycI n=1 Tax=Methanocaldococcus infernus (strain DSM 11812 / JCM 15783 / ME) TaxID=573063 RepID=D5VRL9_METIM|nr:hydrogenase maturation peptidase HycI [Methanocaldococcus infernus]ADG13222.1 hydrogenase maturation protease HycI [Methanocaldococcus infernus ME]